MRKPVVNHVVVVVDDDAEIREALADALTENGYRTTTAANGEQLWQIFKDSACDLLLIDLYLDRENGLQLARQVRQQSDVPIIMLTGKGDETDRILGLELVAGDFLMKPFNLRELLARINDLIMGMLDLVEYSMAPGIAIKTDLRADAPIFVDPSQLENAILNLGYK